MKKRLLFISLLVFYRSLGFCQEDAGYEQMIFAVVGPLRPTSASVSKGNYVFTYDSESTQTLVFGVGGATRLFSLLGAVYLGETLTYSRFNGSYSVDASVAGLSPGSSNGGNGLSMSLFGFDTRITHSWEWFPIRWIIPFVEIGYLFTVFNQFGTTDFNSAQGSTGNATAAGGIRFWLNPSASVRSENTESPFTLPIFLSLKWNQIFGNGQLLDLASNGFYLSASFGL
jgi:hypothetical protein